MSERNINLNNGNYNENIEGDYIQGNKVDNSQVDNRDQSRNFQVGDVGGDFNPTNSPIMSDNTQVTASTNSDSTNSETENKKPNWGLRISIAAIIISACVSGLFNEEIREFLNLNPLPETPEELESQPAESILFG